ncbi:MAG: FkbM family methyltransferase [Chitinophagaceae bacterium]|nr:FkbM family methyltransferase [Chitinophagaceae bacterium]
MKEGSFIANIFNGITTRVRNSLHREKDTYRVNFFYEKYLKHLPANKTHYHKFLGKRTFFRGGPDYLRALKEIFEEQIYNQLLPQKAFIIDCGAHIGMSVIFLKKICPDAEILCFEPDNMNYALLMKNISEQGLKNVNAVNAAVWIDNSMVSFDMEGSMDSKIIPEGHSANQVQAVRLADYIDKKVDFLKIDIEGAEYAVLKDIAPKLSFVDKLFLEYHGSFTQNEELIEMLQIIQSNGFRFYIKEAGPVYPQPFTGIRGSSIYDLQLNIFCIRN